MRIEKDIDRMIIKMSECIRMLSEFPCISSKCPSSKICSRSGDLDNLFASYAKEIGSKARQRIFVPY